MNKSFSEISHNFSYPRTKQKNKKSPDINAWAFLWWGMLDLNQRPPGYEPGALTN